MDFIYTLDQTDQIALQLVQQYASTPVWVFQAPMGAGKTTLISAIGKVMGIQEAMSSPTFSIMNEYQVQQLVPKYRLALLPTLDQVTVHA